MNERIVWTSSILATWIVACSASGEYGPNEPILGIDAPDASAFDANINADVDASTPNPCEGKTCGDVCQCDDYTDLCRVTYYNGVCLPNGQCVDPSLPHACQCSEASDCPTLSICYACPSGDMACVDAQCLSGRCKLYPPDCGPSPGYDPCPNKETCSGPPCVLCDPAKPDCIEPPGDRTCKWSGCTEGYLPCPE